MTYTDPPYCNLMNRKKEFKKSNIKDRTRTAHPSKKYKNSECKPTLKKCTKRHIGRSITREHALTKSLVIAYKKKGHSYQECAKHLSKILGKQVSLSLIYRIWKNYQSNNDDCIIKVPKISLSVRSVINRLKAK